MVILDLYSVFCCIFFAQITESSYNMYVMDKTDRLSKPTDVIHIESNDIEAPFRDRLMKQLNEFLRKARPRHHKQKISAGRVKKKGKHGLKDFRSDSESPVVYSNGRYTLDLDTIDMKDLTDIGKKPNKNAEYIDSNEDFRDYYDYIDINDRLDTNTKIPWRKLKHLAKYIRSPSLRKYNKLLGEEKYFKSRDLADSDENKMLKKKKNKYSKKKRFQIIDNNDKKNIFKSDNSESWEENKNAMKKKTLKYGSDFYNSAAIDNDSFEKKHKKKKKKKKHKKKIREGVEEEQKDDEGVYLQGNVIIKISPKEHDAGSDTESDSEDSDGRRRLHHFLPKRYHWDNDDFYNLGYFWFNGPKGKFPEPTLAD